jgi:hypothetical protein
VALRHFVRPVIAALLAHQLIDSFFFIRYTLGGPHLRLRYRLTPDTPPAATAEILEGEATRFLEHWPSEVVLDPERIRQESRAILAVVPEESGLYYQNHSLLPFPFEPEVDRYGGRELLESSLDFFAISSAQTLEMVRGASWGAIGRRAATVLRLLLRQARGFAATEEEFLSHLGYRLPMDPEICDQIWRKADGDFEARQEIYRNLLKHELSILAEADTTTQDPTWTDPAFLYQAAKRLSRVVRGAAPATRWQIGHSQLHMTANRLGFFPIQEMHLQRILWRAAHDLKEAEPATWRQVMIASRDRQGVPRWSLRQLLEPMIDDLRKSNCTSNAET